MSGTPGAAQAFTALLEGIGDTSYRRGLVEHLLRHAVSEAAASIFPRGIGSNCQACQVLDEFDATLEQAGKRLGMGQAASSEHVRKALVKVGKKDIARDWSPFRQGRRACAHPKRDLQRKVLQALELAAAESDDRSADDVSAETFDEASTGEERNDFGVEDNSGVYRAGCSISEQVEEELEREALGEKANIQDKEVIPALLVQPRLAQRIAALGARMDLPIQSDIEASEPTRVTLETPPSKAVDVGQQTSAPATSCEDTHLDDELACSAATCLRVRTLARQLDTAIYETAGYKFDHCDEEIPYEVFSALAPRHQARHFGNGSDNSWTLSASLNVPRGNYDATSRLVTCTGEGFDVLSAMDRLHLLVESDG